MALFFELNTWEQICSNHTVFSQIFVTSKMKQGLNITALHHLICNIVNAPIDFQKLLKELMDNVDGFKELFNAVSDFSDLNKLKKKNEKRLILTHDRNGQWWGGDIILDLYQKGSKGL